MRYDNIVRHTIYAPCFALLTILILSAPARAQQGGGPPAPSAPPAGLAQGSVRLPAEAKAPSPEQPRGALGDAEGGLPAGTDSKAGGAGLQETPAGDDRVYLNVQDQDIKDVIKQISKATGRNFIIDGKVSGKVTILSEKTMSKEEAYQAFLSALEVANYTTVTGPGGIIKIVSLKDAVSSPIPIHVDSTPYTDSYITRLIALKNISALEMSNAIKGLISKSGNMFAYPATNTLIITDSGTNIDRLMKIIKELDQEGPQQVLEIIPIIFADAKDIASKVLSLFELEKTGQAKASRPGAGAELEEIKDVSKIIADDRTNSLIVLASKRAIDKVRGIIAKLDVPLKDGDTGSIHVYYLKYAKAADIAQTLTSITSGVKAAAAKTGGKEGEKSAPAPKGPLPVAQLEGGISIGADENTNSLIITASAKDFQTLVDELISKLDVPARQVYLEAIIMELRVSKAKTAGVSGFGGGGNKSAIGFGSSGSGDFNVLNSLFSSAAGAGTGFFGAPGLLGGLLSRDTITLSLPKAGGGTTPIEIPAFAAFLNLLQTYHDANIVSSPNIMTVDNQKASIEVTHKEYIPTTTIMANAGATTSGSQPVEAGLTLEITPQITEGNAVRLQIHNRLSNFEGKAIGNLGPPENKREITTTVVAMDGQTVVLGGLMQDEVTNTKSKVPILGDIPLIGLLFRSSSGGTSKSSLLVFITPHVIKDPSDFAEITKMKIEQRNRFIDQNFGKRQQKTIRDTIANHRADLLEFIPAAPASSTSSSYQPSPDYSPPLAAVTQGSSASPASSKGAVITVAPIGPSGSGGSSTSSSTYSPDTAPRKSGSAKSSDKKSAPAEEGPQAPVGHRPKSSGDIDNAY